MNQWATRNGGQYEGIKSPLLHLRNRERAMINIDSMKCYDGILHVSLAWVA
jgi:hypothetical protein